MLGSHQSINFHKACVKETGWLISSWSHHKQWPKAPISVVAKRHLSKKEFPGWQDEITLQETVEINIVTNLYKNSAISIFWRRYLYIQYIPQNKCMIKALLCFILICYQSSLPISFRVTVLALRILYVIIRLPKCLWHNPENYRWDQTLPNHHTIQTWIMGIFLRCVPDIIWLSSPDVAAISRLTQLHILSTGWHTGLWIGHLSHRDTETRDAISQMKS